jgi:iron complex outermembrane recepter protein
MNTSMTRFNAQGVTLTVQIEKAPVKKAGKETRCPSFLPSLRPCRRTRYVVQMKSALNILSLFLLLVLVQSTAAIAQPADGKIIGMVGDETQKALPLATISLLNSSDSAVLRQTVSDKTGHFEFRNVPFGKYRISASAIGHSTAFSLVFGLFGGSITINDLFLHEKAHELASVAVVGQKPLFEQKADRMIINVDASPTNAGSTAMDVLERAPGVLVDKADNISLKGRQGVTIMIDNRPTYMSQTQLANYLKSLPASEIDQIEVMTNPPARYDAAGNAGIINIKTKKNRAKGFNGSINLNHTQGVYPRPGGSLNLNYRSGRTNFFLNAGYSDWQNYNTLDLTRKYIDANAAKTINSIFSQHSVFHSYDPEADIKFGMDYFANTRTTYGFVIRKFTNEDRQNSTSNIFLEDPNYNVDSVVYSPSNHKSDWNNYSLNLNFRRQFDSAGSELTADADYITYSSTNNQYFDNITYAPDRTIKDESILTAQTPSDIRIYSFKTDYTHPFSKQFKLDAGLKTSYVTTGNAADYFDLVNGASEVDTTKTNHFDYRENINAAYLNLVRDYKKWSFQAGLRYEYTDYSGHQFANGTKTNKDSSFSNGYGSLFPTIYIGYKLNDKNQFTMNYGRRVDRPAYQDLNPFLFFLDQYTYQAGNPYLQPQFTHNVEIAHVYKNFLTTTLNYNYTSNFFTETFQQQGQASIVRKGNIGQRQNAGIAVSAQVHLTKNWIAIAYGNLNYTQFDGPLYGENIHVEASAFTFNLNNQFSFGNGWAAEISGFYHSKGIQGQLVVDPGGQASTAVSKKLLKDKASLKLGLRDIFYTGYNRGYVDFQQTEASFLGTRDSRQVTIALNYRFGKPLKNSPRRRNSGADEEQNRVNMGN